MTDISEDSPRTYWPQIRKGENPYRNKYGKFELQIVETLNKQQREAFYELTARLALRKWDFPYSEEEINRRLLEFDFNVEKGYQSFKDK